MSDATARASDALQSCAMRYGGYQWGQQPQQQWASSPQQQAWQQYYQQQAQGQAQAQAQGQAQGQAQAQQQYAQQGSHQQQPAGWGAIPQAAHTAHAHAATATAPPAHGPSSQVALANCDRTAIYQRHARPEEIIADVAHLRMVDAAIEKLSSKWTKIAIGLGIATFVQIFIIALFPPILVTFVICGIVLTVAIIKAYKASKLDLENRRYELLARLLEVLARDMAPSYPLHVYLDLRAAELPLKLVNTYKRGSWNFKAYRDNWLWMQGDLLDGNVFTVSMTERLRVRSGWKRGASGKMKHKTKRKSKHEVQVRVAVRLKKHAHIANIAQRGHGAVKLPPYCQPKSLQCKKGELRLKAMMMDWNEPGPNQQPTHVPRASTAIASMLLSLYQVVSLSQQVTKQQKKKAS